MSNKNSGDLPGTRRLGHPAFEPLTLRVGISNRMPIAGLLLTDTVAWETSRTPYKESKSHQEHVAHQVPNKRNGEAPTVSQGQCREPLPPGHQILTEAWVGGSPVVCAGKVKGLEPQRQGRERQELAFCTDLHYLKWGC